MSIIIKHDDVTKVLDDLFIDISKQQFTIEDVVRGANVELEHGRISPLTNVSNDDITVTIKIALAHLFEKRKEQFGGYAQNYDYYDALEIVESAPAGYWRTSLWQRYGIVTILCILSIILILAGSSPYYNRMLIIAAYSAIIPAILWL